MKYYEFKISLSLSQGVSTKTLDEIYNRIDDKLIELEKEGLGVELIMISHTEETSDE